MHFRSTAPVTLPLQVKYSPGVASEWDLPSRSSRRGEPWHRCSLNYGRWFLLSSSPQ